MYKIEHVSCGPVQEENLLKSDKAGLIGGKMGEI